MEEPLTRARSPPVYNMIRFITCACSCYFVHEHECRTAPITIPPDKPPALLEDSQCFTYAEALPECFDRSKHSTQETFHDDRHQ